VHDLVAAAALAQLPPSRIDVERVHSRNLAAMLAW